MNKPPDELSNEELKDIQTKHLDQLEDWLNNNREEVIRIRGEAYPLICVMMSALKSRLGLTGLDVSGERELYETLSKCFEAGYYHLKYGLVT